MTQRRFALAAAMAPLLLGSALAACQQPANDTDIAIDNGVDSADAANADTETTSPGALADEAALPAPDPQARPANVIPAQYRGRWGINANDCDPKRSDNKGLITIRENGIRFYESTAALQEQRPAIATSFSGSYRFTGEGQTWEKVVTLTRTGNTLERADDEGSFTYTRCP
jgi:hypothetical protein